MKKRTRIRTVDGLEAYNGRIGERTITVRVTSDGLGKSLSLADDIRGIMLMIPIEPVIDMIDVVEEGER